MYGVQPRIDQLESGAAPVLATRRDDGSLAVLVRNVIARKPGQYTSVGDPNLQSGESYSAECDLISLRLKLNTVTQYWRAHFTRGDENHGSGFSAYKIMRSPAYPTREQIAELKRAGALKPAEVVRLDQSAEIDLTVPPNGVALPELT